LILVSYEFKNLGVALDIPNIYYLTYWYLKQIPKGKVITYGDLAEILGDIRASRTIGRLMALNKYPDQIPCYKVVHRDGKIGKYSGLGGVKEKISRLKREGVPVINNKIRNLKFYLVDPNSFPNFPYLKSLQHIQEYLSQFLTFDHKIDVDTIRHVVSTDVAYLDGTPDVGIGVAVLFECSKANCKPLNATISFLPIFFPYIPTYLAFRELPPLLLAISSIKSLTNIEPDLYLVDGHGSLHPRCFGIASHLGIFLGKPTIGLAKSRLVGKLLGDPYEKNGRIVQKIVVNSRCYGYRIKPKNSKKELYVSSGHLISPETALEFVSRFGWKGNINILNRLPHIVSTGAKKYLKEVIE